MRASQVVTTVKTSNVVSRQVAQKTKKGDFTRVDPISSVHFFFLIPLFVAYFFFSAYLLFCPHYEVYKEHLHPSFSSSLTVLLFHKTFLSFYLLA